MGERSLRGSRLGSVSYETERNTAPIERQYAEYRCPSGHLFTVPFADDAELPDTWECKFDGSAAKLVLQALSSGAASKKELAEIRKLIDAHCGSRS